MRTVKIITLCSFALFFACSGTSDPNPSDVPPSQDSDAISDSTEPQGDESQLDLGQDTLPDVPEDTPPEDVDPNEELLAPGPRGILKKAPLSSVTEENLAVTPNAPQIEFPVAIEQLPDLTQLKNFLGAPASNIEEVLAPTGVAVLPIKPTTDRFDFAYELLKENLGDGTTLITSDSVLHLYHLFFDQLLKNAEIKYFADDVTAMCKAMSHASAVQAVSLDGDLKEAAIRNQAYFAVCTTLMDPTWPVPAGISDDVTATLELITKHSGFEPNPIFMRGCPDKCQLCDPTIQRECNEEGWYCGCEDFSQYVPRGHYTQSETLERYFKALMWLGRIPFRIASNTETLQAVLATLLMTNLDIETQDGTVPLVDRWYRLYQVTGFFVGAADDLTFAEYDEAIKEALDVNNVQTLQNPETLAALKEKLRKLRAPAVLSGMLSIYQDLTKETQGFRFMGQRFTPDGYLMGQTVSPYVKIDTTTPDYAALRQGCDVPSDNVCEDITLEQINCVCYAGIDYGPYGPCRFLSRGLDVMSILGSKQADSILEMDNRFCAFQKVLGDLKEEFTKYTTQDWTQNAYWSWLHSLKPVLDTPGEGWPTFTQGLKWRLKQLRTALASWTQLRHDTILYVKQPYTPMVDTAMPEAYGGYVEPVPALYHRLAFLTDFTKTGLENLGVLPPEIKGAMNDMTSLLLSLRDIAMDEVAGNALTPKQQSVIDNYPDTYSYLIRVLAEVFMEPPEGDEGHTSKEPAGDGLRASLVADVHTDGNTRKVLEEAVGNLDWVIVLHKNPENEALVYSIGPIFTYYEFPHPMNDRLTDESWREMLNTSSPPDAPAWFEELY